jgi:squalene monooxygenase
MTWKTHYDVLVVGAGIAGSALGHALATLPRPPPHPANATSSQGAYETGPYPRPLRVCVLERSMAQPDRIVGELLQPGGVRALQKLGLGSCVDGIDAVPVKGYAVVKNGELVPIPYPAGAEGRSFHHGRFIGKLRDALLTDADNSRKAGDSAQATIDVIEASVTELIECDFTGRVIGVRATRKTQSGDAAKGETANTGAGVHPPPADDVSKEAFFADLVVIADGCFSNFRTQVLGPTVKATTKSHFVGVVLDDVQLPLPQHGTVCLVKDSGPVLLYQIAGRDTRMLVDIKAPLPSDLKVLSFLVFLMLDSHFLTGSHYDEDCPTAPSCTPARRPHQPGERPSSTHAGLLPPAHTAVPHRDQSATRERGYRPPRRRVEHAPSTHWRWYDGRPF